MTREEAIENLRVIREHTLAGNWYEEEALEMAISALEQKPCNVYEERGLKADTVIIDEEAQKPCEDAVSREAVRNCFNGFVKMDKDTLPYVEDYLKTVMRRINELPSVTRQTKSHKEKVTYHKCKECQWLANEKMVIGRKCVNPHKVWKSRTAMWHQPSCKACKMFKPYKEEGAE